MDPSVPPWLHLVSAFLAMEPPDFLVSLSRVCGGGSITECVQRFIWNHCIKEVDGKGHAPYLRNFLKKLIVEVEVEGTVVLDELYEQFAFYTAIRKSDDLGKQNLRVLKQLSFLFPDDSVEAPTRPISKKLLIPLQCSVNMLEGNTGCCIWPSSLFLSEFILSCPELFSGKSCFELLMTEQVGSGVGLVGICLSHVGASQVVLSDGNLSSLANLKLNLELNQLNTVSGVLGRINEDSNTVNALHLPWESASDRDFLHVMADVVLGADVIYDPLCIPHLVKVLAVLLNQKRRESCSPNTFTNADLKRSNALYASSHGYDACEGEVRNTSQLNPKNDCIALMTYPVAYIALVIRNVDTFGFFLKQAEEANLSVMDVTEKITRLDLLPYMTSYQPSDIRLLAISYLSH